MLSGLFFVKLSARLLVWLPMLHLFLNTAVSMENPLAGRISTAHTHTNMNIKPVALRMYVLIGHILTFAPRLVSLLWVCSDLISHHILSGHNLPCPTSHQNFLQYLKDLNWSTIKDWLLVQRGSVNVVTHFGLYSLLCNHSFKHDSDFSDGLWQVSNE